MKTASVLLLAGLTLSVYTLARAEPANSLSRARSEVIDGTTPGILIFGERPAAAPKAAEAATPAPKPVEAVKSVVPAATTGAAATAAATPVSRPVVAAPAAAVVAVPRVEPVSTPVAAPVQAAAPVSAPMPVPSPATAQVPRERSAFERLGTLLGASRPLSGEPLNAAKSHESTSNGIPIPTAADHAKAVSEPGSAKP
jgi:hypothetical protein